MRRILVAGNWKMHGSGAMVKELLDPFACNPLDLLEVNRVSDVGLGLVLERQFV